MSSLDQIENKSEEEEEDSDEGQDVNIPISFATEAGLKQHRLNKDGSDWLLNGFLSFQCEICGDRFKNEKEMNKVSIYYDS